MAKIYPNKISEYIKEISLGLAKPILLHGQNIGMIDSMIKFISKSTIFKSVIKYDINQIDQRDLISMLYTQDLIAQNKLIVLQNAKASSFSKDFLEHLQNNPQKENLLCITSGESLTSTVLRKTFEKSEVLYIMPCYNQEKKDLVEIIYKKLTGAAKKPEQEVIDFLADNLEGDSAFVRLEIDKLLLFTKDKETISIEDAQNVICKNQDHNSDLICYYFANAKHKNFLEEAQKALENNVSEFLIIRSLIRYYVNLFYVKQELGDGTSLDVAIRQLKPPIFFKYINLFKQSLRCNEIDRITDKLSKLHDAEKAFKENGGRVNFVSLF